MDKKQNTGHWITMYESKNMVACSKCNKCTYLYNGRTSAYCPHCGDYKGQAQADGEATDDDIATMRILFNADIECLCNQGRFNDAKEMEQIRDRLMASLQADGEYFCEDYSCIEIEKNCENCEYVSPSESNDNVCRNCDNKSNWKLKQEQADGDIITALCSLPKIISEDGQDYVQLADALETVRRYKPSVAIPSAEPKWIPVSERLPEKNGRYLCTVGTDYRNPREMYYEPKGKNNRTWASLDSAYVEDCFVIAWMPLPPCYDPQERSE